MSTITISRPESRSLLSPAFHAISSCDLAPGQWVVVVGCGGVGQYAIQYARAMNLNVLGLDVNDSALEQAKTLGATEILNTKSDPDAVKKLHEITKGGAHAAAIFSGAKSAFDTGLDCLKLNGLLMVVGMPKDPLQVDALDLVAGRYRIKGESTSTPQRMKKAIDFTAENDIKSPATFYKLEDVHTMLAKMEKGQSNTKMIVLF